MLQAQNNFETISGQLIHPPLFSFYYQKLRLGLAKFRRYYIEKQNKSAYGSIRNQRSSRIKRR